MNQEKDLEYRLNQQREALEQAKLSLQRTVADRSDDTFLKSENDRLQRDLDDVRSRLDDEREKRKLADEKVSSAVKHQSFTAKNMNELETKTRDTERNL